MPPETVVAKATPMPASPRRVRFSRSPLSFMSAAWLTPLMVLGAKRPLQLEDLPVLEGDATAAACASIMDRFWQRFAEHQASPTSTKPPSLFAAVAPSMALPLIGTVLLRAVVLVVTVLQPILIQQILQFLNRAPDGPKLVIDSGIGLAFLLFGSQVVISVALSWGRFIELFAKARLRAALVGAAYAKSMRLSPKAQSAFSAGMINSFIISDVDTICFVLEFINEAWSTPALAVISVVLLIKLLGQVAWVSIASIIVFGVLQGFVANPLMKYGRMGAKLLDKRTKALREFLYGIKVIKYRALEELFLSMIGVVRKEQVAVFRVRYALIAGIMSIGFSQGAVVQAVTFVAYAALGGQMRPDIIFPALSYISQVNIRLSFFPMTLTRMQSYFISYHRVAEYLLADEIQPHEATSMLCAADSTDSTALKMSAATFTWEESRKDDEDQKPKFKRRITKKKQKAAAKAEAEAKAAADAAAATATEAGTDAPAEGAAKKDGDAESDKPAPFALHDITLDIPRGSLVAVVGSVGSGKSSFLSALIGGMRKTAGDSALFGSVAYCAQEPWILTGTIEENIVFGDDSVRARIPDAIAAACLDRDLEILPNGLGTQIGEKGINLSGGQKARVALARAIARDADIYLLDDPIAALDAHVGKKVFDDAICGVLRGKTVFLVTHQLHLLPKVDMVVVLDEGRIVETGAFRELMAREDGALSEIMKDYHFDDAETETAKEAIEADEGEESEAQQLAKAIKEFEEENAVEEDRRTGAVKLADYLSYFMAGGALYLPSIFVLLALLVAAGSAVQIVLAVWSDPGDTAWGLEKGKFLWIYIGLGLSVAVVNIISCLVIFHNGLNAAQVMHDRAMHALARAPMSFYDSQPVGRILNRMTSDIRNIDGITPQEIVVAINHVSGMVTSLAIVAFSAPYLLIEFGGIGCLFALAFPLYQAAYREIKRLSSILVSPLTAHVSESLNGIPTIRAFGAVARFTESQHSKTDASNVGALLMECAELWVSVRLDLLSSTVALVLVILASYGAVSRTTIGASLVGTISFSESLRNMLIMLSNMAGNFNSVERVNHYARNLPAEAARELPADPKDGAWPTAGALAIRGLEIRYPSRPDHAVIQQLSLDIQPGEKVGVVGRTGSGKSTLMTALFRIMEASKGSIAIDGIDIAALGLKTLRSRLQIIPQEPVLFKGTVRSNLDFATKYSDDELWAALDLVGLKDFVGSLDGKLDAAIEENGANLSMGQRQLMCLCKAILAKPKVLIMDEATASVDAEADKRIQESIETQFAATTVLSIAHRLNTIAAFDRVLVLDGGRIAEFDAPHVLLGRAGSVFGEMVEATGAANAAVIRQIAADHFAKTH